ncbi:uncharacterized protein FAM241B [Exaiptasia diaphana]|uniref:DUF4605 domain-containing protein n=1 Tax=Exaiptasia diaphana TaxID=2652724 RepID=A0A913XS93_EXADI|nr:uncharacterized protein FAM241B [Exaiptasia diaphana]KXJ09579.1 Uncharacterized protein C10orf35-like [Exaiptasia diaphana]
MVTIIDGEIVQDDDPRAQAYKQRNRRPEPTTQSQTEQTFDSTRMRQRPQVGPGGIGGGSIIDQFNNKLLAAGFPRWNLGQNVVEPIVSVMLILALVFFGLKGVLMVGLVWFFLNQAGGQ